MRADPAATPVTIPVLLPTVAIDVLLLLHVPPVTVLENVVVAFWQMVFVPDNVPAVAVEVTVNTLLARHALAVLRKSMVVVPIADAVKMPVADPRDTIIEELLHVPAIVFDKVTVPPTQVVLDPKTVDGAAETVTVAVATPAVEV